MLSGGSRCLPAYVCTLLLFVGGFRLLLFLFDCLFCVCFVLFAVVVVFFLLGLEGVCVVCIQCVFTHTFVCAFMTL